MMRRRASRGSTSRLRALCVLAVTIAVATGAAVAWAAEGTLDLGPPWGEADRTEAENRVVVSYEIKASGNLPQTAVKAGIKSWNDAIDDREDGWDFDLVPLAEASNSSSAGGRPSFHHREGHGGGGGNGGSGKGNGSSGGNGKGGGADISIHLKKGGGPIAGSAKRTIEDGFVVAVKIQISGRAFRVENDSETIEEVTMHELGHALALGHHSNEDDLMGPTVGTVPDEDGQSQPITEVSACDLDGFETAHKWLTTDLGANGAYTVKDTSIECQDEEEEECEGTEAVDVSASEDTCASVLSVSADGNASSTRGATVSGTGDASNGKGGSCRIPEVPPESAPGPPDSCIAVSGMGNASNTGSCNSLIGCIAVSGMGDASNDASNRAASCRADTAISVGCIAVSGMGDASNEAGDTSCGQSFSISVDCIAVSGMGNASNEAGDNISCARGQAGIAVGCVAVSGTGTASNDAGSEACGFGLAGIGIGCIAVSGTGDAANEAGDGSCGDGGAGISVGCIAASGAGEASNKEGGDECESPKLTVVGLGCIAVPPQLEAEGQARRQSSR